MSSKLWLFILFGVLGIFGEVVFTAILDIFKHRRLRLHGFSFLWMFPIYGLLAFCFEPAANAIRDFPWVVRGLIYMTGIYLVEFITGTVLTALTGAHIWQYTDRWNYKGQITLLYVPVWFSVGLLVERYYPWAEKVSRLLALN
jgi:uncharacterized membrane protein